MSSACPLFYWSHLNVVVAVVVDVEDTVELRVFVDLKVLLALDALT